MTLDHQPPPAGYDEPPYDPEFDQPGVPARPDDRTPPNDLAAERYVLGAAMLDQHDDGALLTELASLVTPPDFWDPRHETIWRTILHLRAADQPTQAQAVVAHLIDTREINRVGGGDYIHHLTTPTVCPLPANGPYYAARVDKLARRRAAIHRFEQGLQRLRNPGDDTDVDDVLNTVTTQLLEARDSLGNPPAPTTWSPVDLEPVLAGEYLDPPPTILTRADGTPLIYDNAVHTISGESESGKTWLTLLAALQLIAEDQRVVFLDFEDRADRVIGRLMALGATPAQIRANFAYIRPDRPLDDDGRTQLAPALTGTRLVIIDGVTEAMTMHGYDLNNNADSALFQGLLPRWIADHGPAVVMIDHVVKDKEKQDRFALGAQHKLAGIDGVAYIVKMLTPFARGKRGIARVEIAKDRPGHVREYAHGRTIAEFTLDATASDVVLTAHLLPPGGETGRAGDHFEPTILMEKISRYVQLNPGLSKKAIEDVVNGKTATKRLALELLVTRGYIGTKSGAKGAIQHFHIRPYYADPDKDPDAQTDSEDEQP